MNIKLLEFCEEVRDNNAEAVGLIVDSEWFMDNAEYYYQKFELGMPKDNSEEEINKYLNSLSDDKKAVIIYDWCAATLNSNFQYDFGYNLFEDR